MTYSCTYFQLCFQSCPFIILILVLGLSILQTLVHLWFISCILYPFTTTFEVEICKKKPHTTTIILHVLLQKKVIANSDAGLYDCESAQTARTLIHHY